MSRAHNFTGFKCMFIVSFQLMGDKPKLDMFGPSDFVPTHPYSLPMKQHGPMKLTYMSAKEFPNIPKYGLIPIPRK